MKTAASETIENAIERETRSLYETAQTAKILLKEEIFFSPDFKGTRKQRRRLAAAEEALAVITCSALKLGIRLYEPEPTGAQLPEMPVPGSSGTGSLPGPGQPSAESSQSVQ